MEVQKDGSLKIWKFRNIEKQKYQNIKISNHKISKNIKNTKYQITKYQKKGLNSLNIPKLIQR